MYPYKQGQGYPSQPGYPTNQPGFAPPQTGFAVNMPGFPDSNPAYPPSNQGYPPSSQGYPPSSQGYPPSSQGYPSSNQGYPTSNQGHPRNPHPQSNSSYPTHPASNPYPSNTAQIQPAQPYPTQGNAYPPTSGYPQASPRHHGVSHPSQQKLYNTPCQNVVAPRSRPTVVPVSPFNPRQDAEALRKAMKGWGTNEKAIIDVLTKRSNAQRIEIGIEFKTLYGKDLISDLKGETSGNFRDLVVALMTPLPKFYARELHDAIAGLGTNEEVLIEILCTLPNYMIKSIQQAYNASYGTLLEDDIIGDTSGNFKRILISLATGNRSEDFRVNPVMAKQDAQNLLAAGEQRLGTDESVFNMVFATRSLPQLSAVFREYQALTGHDIEFAIKKEFSGNIEKALRAIVRAARDMSNFFAEHLHQSMKGLGTNDRKLIRIMVTRSEVDLADISEAFKNHYGQTLQEWIADDCSGDYKKALLALLNDQ